MKSKQTSRKDIDRVKIIRTFDPENQSILKKSLQSVFAQWLEESYTDIQVVGLKEAKNEQRRRNHSGINDKTA